MLCAERVQRILMAIMLGLVLGLAGSGMMKAAFILQVFIMVMLLVWAFTNFCPSTWVLERLIGKCDFDKDGSENG